MRRLILIAVTLVVLLGASPLSACQKCDLLWLWPWLDDCWFCDPTNCGAELCEITEESCNNDGLGCWDGTGQCSDVWWLNGVLVHPAPSLNSTWRLASVRVIRPSGSRSTARPPVAMKNAMKRG
jgi:hypothetical protein